MQLQPYDLLMLAVLALAIGFGFWKGLAWQIASLGSLILSYVVALKFSATLAPHISAQQPWNRFAAMLILYLGTGLAVWIVFRRIKQIIERVQLKSFDRQVGAMFGAAKGVVLCVAITFFAVSLSEASRNQVLKARSGKYISQFLEQADPIMPRELKGLLAPYLRELEEELDPRRPFRRPRVADDLSREIEDRVR